MCVCASKSKTTAGSTILIEQRWVIRHQQQAYILKTTENGVSRTQNKEDRWTEGQCLQTVTQNCQLYLSDVSELEHT